MKRYVRIREEFRESQLPRFSAWLQGKSPIQGIREEMATLTHPKAAPFPFSLIAENAPIFRMVMRKGLRENLSLIFPEFPEWRS